MYSTLTMAYHYTQTIFVMQYMDNNFPMTAMLYYGYAPQLFLRSTMIPIPKGGKVCSTNADLYRSIAISSILSKI